MLITNPDRLFRRILVLLLICLLSDSSNAQLCQPVLLRCEYLERPLGIDATHPRLSWQLNDTRTGARQTAYQLFVGTDTASLLQDPNNYRITDKVSSAAQQVRYAGKTLAPFTRYYWQVRVWDKDGVATLSAISYFETGMMQMANWHGAWISDTRDIHLKPAPCFRKEFNAGKKIKTARAYIAAAGLYELTINGQRVGDHRLDPMYTRFDRRILYVTHDITPLLNSGANAIGVLLGNGWYNHQSTAVWYFHEAPWRNRPAFCMDIRVVYEDNSVEVISTGKGWKTTLSPVIFNSIYTAEQYDARKEIPGWDRPGFDDSKWKDIIYRSAPASVVAAQVMHPIRRVETIQAVSSRRFSDSLYVFDIGRNMAGVSSIRVSGKAGTIIRLKHGERLYANGRVDQSNIDAHYRPVDDKDPFQTDIFILKGGGEESFTPRFNYKGFKYIEVSSSEPLSLTKENLTAYFMHSDVPVAGQVQSTDTLINKLWKATNSSYLSNLFGYPTDCPQREKNGWTGDAQIAIETGLYNFDGITIYEKWMADHRDEQQPNGVLPSIIPTDGWGYEWGNGPDWTSTIAIIPWNIYLFYGDTSLLAACYDNIKRYVDHIDDTYPSGLTNWGLGDWIPVKSQSPVEFTSTAYYYTDTRILANAAKLLGHVADQQRYTVLAEKIRSAFNAKYLDPATGMYGNGLQTELSVALFWKLVPDTLIAKTAALLAKRVAADSMKLDVGLLGTKAVLNALSENGYSSIAYQLATRKTFPSWGWWIVNGATTLYENWPIDAKSDISMNHIMFGEIGAWVYKGLGGIYPDPQQPGFKHVLLKPYFAEGLRGFSAEHKSPYGTIVSSWQRTKKGLQYTVVIPANSTATVSLDIPAGKRFFINAKEIKRPSRQWVQQLEAGSYLLEWK